MLTTTEVSELLACSRPHVVELIEAGRLPALEIGTRTQRVFRVLPRKLEVFMDGETESF